VVQQSIVLPAAKRQEMVTAAPRNRLWWLEFPRSAWFDGVCVASLGDFCISVCVQLELSIDTTSPQKLNRKDASSAIPWNCNKLRKENSKEVAYCVRVYPCRFTALCTQLQRARECGMFEWNIIVAASMVRG
jgi:hypothetical protein